MSGATNCPETPRQKMIGMMYLVLTAMLALNVSTDVLNGFKLVDKSIHTSMDATMARNANLYAQFQAARDENPAKVDSWYKKSLELKKHADSLFDYIQDFKEHIVILADGAEKVEARRSDPECIKTLPDGTEYADITLKIEGNSNLDVAAQYAIVEGNGEILRNKITEFKKYLISLDVAREAMFNRVFATDRGWNSHDKDSCDWEIEMFEGMPVGASVTLLTRIQGDIRNAESQMIAFLMDQTDAGDLRVNKMNAYVIPKSDYVIRGGKYSAKIILAAVDTTQKPNYYINGNKLSGDGIYEVTASGNGVQKFTGRIEYKAADGLKSLPFESQYTVGEPAATISNLDLDVVYRNFNNNFSISVPGVSNDKVTVQVSSGTTCTKKGDNWIVKPGDNVKEVTISVFAELEGRKQQMGKQTYRVKALPKPGVYFKIGDAEYEGNITRNQLLDTRGRLVTSYGPDGLLNLPWNVVSFKVNINGILSEVKGDKFNTQIMEQLGKLKKGSMIGLVDISAKGPDGKVTKLSNVLLTMN